MRQGDLLMEKLRQEILNEAALSIELCREKLTKSQLFDCRDDETLYLLVDLIYKIRDRESFQLDVFTTSTEIESDYVDLVLYDLKKDEIVVMSYPKETISVLEIWPKLRLGDDELYYYIGEL